MLLSVITVNFLNIIWEIIFGFSMNWIGFEIRCNGWNRKPSLQVECNNHARENKHDHDKTKQVSCDDFLDHKAREENGRYVPIND